MPQRCYLASYSFVLLNVPFFNILLNILIAEEFKFSSQNDKNVTRCQSMIYLTIQYNGIYILCFPVYNGTTMTFNNHRFLTYLHKQIH